MRDDLLVRGRSVRASFVGSQTGTAWVALHGYPDTLRVFEPLAHATADFARTLLFDWPGQGKSDDLAVHDPWARAELLAEILDAAELPKVALVAHDMGVLPALAFAARFPERTSRLVLGPALLDDRGPVSTDIALLRGAHLYPLVLSLAPGMVFDRCVGSFLQPGHALAEDALAEMRADFVARRDAVIALCRAYDGALPTFLDDLGSVPRPLDLVAPDDEGAHFPRAHAEALAQRVPGARIHALAPGAARHWALAQGGAALAKIVEIMRFPS